jgi:hypothetical protein
MTRNDIGKQFFANCMGPGAPTRIVTLQAISMIGNVLMANVLDPAMPNPSNIPGLDSYWLNADTLRPIHG